MSGIEIAERLAGKHGGTWSSADQGTILKLAVKMGVESANRGGVCWEVSRRWVQARVLGTWQAGVTIYDILSPMKGGFEMDTDKIEELIRVHASRNTSGVGDNYKIAGLNNHPTLYRTYSCFGAGGLKSREAVLRSIFETPGAYIFSFLAATGGGHAIAFDTRAAPYAMMDPNSGDGTFATENNFKAFFTAYYGEAYKAEYTKGERELTRYTKGAVVNSLVGL